MSASIGLPGMGIMGREVYPNSKCESCMHYSRLSGLRGACTKGLAPASCGSGDMPVAGYFPIVGSGLEHGPGVDPTHTPDGDSGPPLGADAPHVEVLEHRVGTAYDGLVKALVESQVKYMRTGCPMHNFSVGLTAVGGATAKSCSCNPVQLEPIAQALQNAIPQGKQLGIEDEAFLEFAFKATERVFPTSDKPGPPSVYLPGVHSPASPVRKTKKKVLAKAVHPLTVSYDRTFKEAVAHAGELSKPGPGGKSDVGTKLLQAARQHVDVGMKLKDYPGSDKAAAHHWQLAAEHAGTPRGHAHVAIANAYEHVGKTKKSVDSEGVDGWQEDLAKAETPAIPEAVRSAETWDGKKKAAMEAVRSNRLDHRSHSRQAAIHTNLETKFAENGDEAQAQLHGAMAHAHSVHADHAPDAKFLPTKLAKAEHDDYPNAQTRVVQAATDAAHAAGKDAHARHFAIKDAVESHPAVHGLVKDAKARMRTQHKGEGSAFHLAQAEHHGDLAHQSKEMNGYVHHHVMRQAHAALYHDKFNKERKVGKGIEGADLAKATNQPHLPDDVRWKAREMQRQGVKIGADHPLAHAVRSAAKEHVGSSYKHFGQQDHAQHVAFHHEAGQVAEGYEKPAHDALAAAHTTYGKTKTQLTYKAYSGTERSGMPKDSTIEAFHQSHADVHQAASEAHAAGVGSHSFDPRSHKLRLAAKRHALIGQQFDHHVDNTRAAAYHHGRAEGFGDTHHGLAARAIAHAYEEHAKAEKSFYEVNVAKSLIHGKLVAKSESSKLAAKIAHSAHQHEYVNHILNRTADTQSDHALPKFERSQGHLANAIHHAHGAALASHEHGDAHGVKRAMKAARGYMKDHKQFYSHSGFGDVHADLKKQHRKVREAVNPKTIEASGHYNASAKKLTAGNVGEH